MLDHLNEQISLKKNKISIHKLTSFLLGKTIQKHKYSLNCRLDLELSCVLIEIIEKDEVISNYILNSKSLLPGTWKKTALD